MGKGMGKDYDKDNESDRRQAMNGAWMISAKDKDASQPEKPPDNPIPLPRPENEPPRPGKIPEEPIAPQTQRTTAAGPRTTGAADMGLQYDHCFVA
ncbi:MAG TPA: hypothetical protein VGX70_04490 [Gemmataceae bacterium]|jgi:hypothetical protein|nr:hypothetical protein [Gemmataceae bacterium]